jgi:hypothetical protein
MTKAPQARTQSDYLVVLVNNVSRNSEADEKIARFMLQSAARELAPSTAVRTCLRAVIPGRDCVEIWHSPTRQRAYYKNLITCNRIWVCPVCASKITTRRRDELARLLAVRDLLFVPDGKGSEKAVTVPRFYLGLATFTIKHRKSEKLTAVLGRLKRAYNRTWGGRWMMAWKARHRVIGTLRAIEVTYGENGWHPHIHTLIVRDSANTPSTVFNMAVDLTLRWEEVTEATGAEASRLHGVEFSAADEKAADYIGKMGQTVEAAIKRWSVVDELTRYPAKRGREASRSLWDLLADYVGDDVRAGTLWIEAVSALRGTMFLRPSNGLWNALGASDSVGDDAEMAQEPENATDAILASLSLDQWRLVVVKNRRGELLEVASAGDPERVAEFLRGLE